MQHPIVYFLSISIDADRMHEMRILVLSDNQEMFDFFAKLVLKRPETFDFFYSAANKDFLEKYKHDDSFKPIDLRNQDRPFFDKYDLCLSLHCKQIFPDWLVDSYRCINVHPGFNPYNRGWYPHVFSIINGLPAGATIHEMDSQLDHGRIIYQEKVAIKSTDTSYEVYRAIQNLEFDLLEAHLDDLIYERYESYPASNEGNINSKEDFQNLCKIDLSQQGSFEDFYNLLRALTFEGFDNAYFIDKNGDKVFLSIQAKRLETEGY